MIALLRHWILGCMSDSVAAVSGERTPLACSIRQLGEYIVITSREENLFAASCRELRASGLCSPESDDRSRLLPNVSRPIGLDQSALATRMAGDDAAIHHLVDPIAGFGDRRIMRGEEQRFVALFHERLQQFECAFRIFRVEISSRLVG